MVLDFDYESAKSTIYNLKVDDLKTLLLIDKLPRSGKKDDLQKRILTHLDSNQKSEHFLNAIKAASQSLAQAQAQNQSKFKYRYIIYIQLS